jgi:hypothetical protein
VFLCILCLCIGNLTGIGVSFAYSVEGELIVVRARALGALVYWVGRVPLERVVDCRPFSFEEDVFPGGWLWGVVFRRWWTLVLRKPMRGMRRLFITPSNASEVAAIREAIERVSRVRVS